MVNVHTLKKQDKIIIVTVSKIQMDLVQLYVCAATLLVTMERFPYTVQGRFPLIRQLILLLVALSDYFQIHLPHETCVQSSRPAKKAAEKKDFGGLYFSFLFVCGMKDFKRNIPLSKCESMKTRSILIVTSALCDLCRRFTWIDRSEHRRLDPKSGLFDDICQLIGSIGYAVLVLANDHDFDYGRLEDDMYAWKAGKGRVTNTSSDIRPIGSRSYEEACFDDTQWGPATMLYPRWINGKWSFFQSEARDHMKVISIHAAELAESIFAPLLVEPVHDSIQKQVEAICVDLVIMADELGVHLPDVVMWKCRMKKRRQWEYYLSGWDLAGAIDCWDRKHSHYCPKHNKIASYTLLKKIARYKVHIIRYARRLHWAKCHTKYSLCLLLLSSIGDLGNMVYGYPHGNIELPVKFIYTSACFKEMLEYLADVTITILRMGFLFNVPIASIRLPRSYTLRYINLPACKKPRRTIDAHDGCSR